MSDTASELLVLGLGNVLLGDDGAGPAVIARLRDGNVVPAGLRLFDGGTLVRLEGADVGPAVATRLSPHQVGVADLLEGARWHDREPERLVLLGVVPESIELGVGLSRPVLRALPQLIDLVSAEARACGFPLVPAVSGQDDTAFDVARWLGGAAQ